MSILEDGTAVFKQGYTSILPDGTAVDVDGDFSIPGPAHPLTRRNEAAFKEQMLRYEARIQARQQGAGQPPVAEGRATPNNPSLPLSYWCLILPPGIQKFGRSMHGTALNLSGQDPSFWLFVLGAAAEQGALLVGAKDENAKLVGTGTTGYLFLRGAARFLSSQTGLPV